MEELDPEDRDVLDQRRPHPARRADRRWWPTWPSWPGATCPRSPRARSASTSWCSSAVEAATTHGRSRGVTFAASMAPTWISGSPARIERAVDNLLDNAVKYSPDGGRGRGGLRRRRPRSSATTAPGSPTRDIDHIFDRFYRAPEARSRPGSGLGLAIVAQVALDEGGQVSVHHAPGAGRRLPARLPHRRRAPPPRLGTSPTDRTESPAAHRTGALASNPQVD